MNVASLELCKELYELSRWDDTLVKHFIGDTYKFDEKLAVETVYEKLVHVTANKVGCDECEGFYASEEDWIPAYDLGYLLRKLPKTIGTFANERWLCLEPITEDAWAAYYGKREKAEFDSWADTPEDAAAKLCIELFKQGVITRGGDA